MAIGGDVMKSILKSALSIVTFAAASFAADASACEFRYATQLAEVSGEAKLQLAANALRDVTSQLESGLGDKTGSREVQLGAGYTISAAGGLAQGAYSETVDSFFQCLKEAYADDPAKLALLEERRKELIVTLDSYFDIGRWLPENVQRRDEKREELQSGKSRPAPFTLAEINSKLPRPNFDTVKAIQVFANLDLPGVNLDACGGFVKRSIRKVDASVLSSLPLIRATVVNYLAGDDAGAKIDMWLFASQQMSRQMIQSRVEEKIRIEAATISCLRDQSAAIDTQLQKAATEKADESSPAPSTASQAT
jgi:hypothetical protein